MRRKRDRSGGVALAATTIVIILIGVSLFSIYSLSKSGNGTPANAEAAGTERAMDAKVLSNAGEAATEAADSEAPKDNGSVGTSRLTGDNPLKITGVIDLGRRGPAPDLQASESKEPVQDTKPEVSAEPETEAPKADEPVYIPPVVEPPVRDEVVKEEPVIQEPVYEELAYEEAFYEEPEMAAYEESAAEPEELSDYYSAAQEYAATQLNYSYAEPIVWEFTDDDAEEVIEPDYAYAQEYEEELPQEESYQEDQSGDGGAVWEEESWSEDVAWEEESWTEDSTWEEESWSDDSYEETAQEEVSWEEEPQLLSGYWDTSLYDIWDDENGTWIVDRSTGEIFNALTGPAEDYSVQAYEEDYSYESYEEPEEYDESYETYEESEEYYEEEYTQESGSYWDDTRYDIWVDDVGVWVFDRETGELFNEETGPDPDYGTEPVWEETYEEYDSEEYDSEEYDEEYYEEEYDDEYDSEDYDEDYYEEEETYYSLGQQIVDYAMGFVGVTPYVWGGNSLYGGTDCSGFVHLIFGTFGIYCSHASLDYTGGSFGYRISYDELQPGDIVVYGGGDHVAIYAGNGYVVHCSSPENGTVYWDMNYRSDMSWFLRVL